VAATVDQFPPDLAAAVAAARPVEVPPELLGAARALTPDQVTPDLVASLAAGLGFESAGGPMAAVNTLLDAAAPHLREALLTGFLSLLQRPAG
jgi:sphinganine-1-phosphate aldolase